jgi:hypothetical protein
MRFFALVLLFAVIATGAGVETVHPEPARVGGWQWANPANWVSLNSGKRNHVFYVGEPLTFTLGGSASTYEVRNYYGAVVDQGAAGGSITIKTLPPGWYKLYLYGSSSDATFGDARGGTMFVVFRNNANFPARQPTSNTYTPEQLGDEVASGLCGVGPDRIRISDAGNPAGCYPYLDAMVSQAKQYYVGGNPDPARPRSLLMSFANGTTNLDGVGQIVSRYKNDVKYWEPRNEPNDGTFGGYGGAQTFLNTEMIPFYNKVKSVDPTAKVTGPGVVSIGPSLTGWLQGFFDAGGGNYIDAFSFHAYNDILGDVWYGRERLKALNTLLAHYGKSGIEKWQTEQGWSAATYGVFEPCHQGRWTMVQMMVFEQFGIPK